MEQSSIAVSNRSALIVALLILVMAVWLLIAAYDFSGGSGVFPRFIGWVFVGLTLIEVVVHLKALVSGPAGRTGYSASTNEIVLKEIKGFLWIVFFLVAVYLTGFMIGIPLYIFAFLRLSAGRSFQQCAIMAVAATIFVYILFRELLEYRLYAGVLFGA